MSESTIVDGDRGEPAKPGRRYWVYAGRGLAILLAVVVLGLILFVVLGKATGLATYLRVQGPAMEPTARSGSLVFYHRPLQPIHRGDIVVFNHTLTLRYPFLMMRVVALPGETVEVRDGLVFVNGRALSEPYAKERVNYKVLGVRLGASEYYVLGDNRNHSLDSQVFGPISAEQIVGVVLWVW